MLDACQKAGFVPRVAQTARYMHTIVGLVAAGMGVALVSESLANLTPKGCVYRPLAERNDALTIDLGVAWHANARSLPAASAVGRRRR